MRSLKRLNAWLDNEALRDVDSRIYITQITEPDSDATLEWGTCPGTLGQRLLQRTRTSKKIVIEFDIRELFDLAARQAIVTAANGWAKDGILRVSYRPDQRLRVIRSKAASIADARDVTGKYTIEYTAGPYPFWEDETPKTLALAAGTTGSGTLIVPGQVYAGMEITVTPGSETLNTLSLTIKGQTMAFANLGVAAGTALAIGHDGRGLLTIRAGNTSKLSKRTAASVDDFNIAAGSAAISYTANTSCTVKVSARGRYM